MRNAEQILLDDKIFSRKMLEGGEEGEMSAAGKMSAASGERTAAKGKGAL
jgi:hypothetical protein